MRSSFGGFSLRFWWFALRLRTFGLRATAVDVHRSSAALCSCSNCHCSRANVAAERISRTPSSHAPNASSQFISISIVSVFAGQHITPYDSFTTCVGMLVLFQPIERGNLSLPRSVLCLLLLTTSSSHLGSLACSVLEKPATHFFSL